MITKNGLATVCRWKAAISLQEVCITQSKRHFQQSARTKSSSGSPSALEELVYLLDGLREGEDGDAVVIFYTGVADGDE